MAIFSYEQLDELGDGLIDSILGKSLARHSALILKAL